MASHDHSRLKVTHVELAYIYVRELDDGARRGNAGEEQDAAFSQTTAIKVNEL